MGNKLKTSEYQGEKTYCFFCPGCDSPHCITDGWKFNGNNEAPTFTPSVLVHYGDNPPPDESPYRCHSFITDGKIQFLSDCTHDKAGQTVDLPDYPDRYL